MIDALYFILDTGLRLYFWVIIISVVLSWLVQFGIVDPYNAIVRQVREALYRLTEPALGPIRNFLPDLGGIDLSPIVLIVLVEAARIALRSLFFG